MAEKKKVNACLWGQPKGPTRTVCSPGGGMPHSPWASCLCNANTAQTYPTHPDELTGGSGKPEAGQGLGMDTEARAPLLLLPLPSRVVWGHLANLRFYLPIPTQAW